MKAERGAAPVRTWLAEPMTTEVERAVRRLARLPDVVRVAIMPDVHLAEQVCVGAVVATRGLIYPAAVGGDIGCGIATVRLSETDGLDPPAAMRVLAGWKRAVPAMRHASLDSSPAPPESLDPGTLASPEAASIARREGRIELGTLGRGNHFLELQADEEGRLWLMVHSGSRAVGQAVMRAHLRGALPAGGGLLHLDAATPAGAAYLSDAAWAVRYAAANRLLMLRAAAAVIERERGAGAEWATLVDCNHNHVREEVHEGTRLLVHRKGAGAAGKGEPGLIPGSMGTQSFHVSGRGEPQALDSSSHGAGRALSRAEARRRVTPRDLREQTRGIVFDERLAGDLVEEAPGAYKDIGAVMRAQRELVRIVRRVRTVVCYKGV